MEKSLPYSKHYLINQLIDGEYNPIRHAPSEAVGNIQISLKVPKQTADHFIECFGFYVDQDPEYPDDDTALISCDTDEPEGLIALCAERITHYLKCPAELVVSIGRHNSCLRHCVWYITPDGLLYAEQCILYQPFKRFPDPLNEASLEYYKTKSLIENL